MILAVFFIGVYYVMSNSAPNNITVKLVSLRTDVDTYTLSFYAYTTINVSYSGRLPCTLSDREVTLYLNGINFGTKGFSESWETFEPGESQIYTTTFVLDDPDFSTLYKYNRGRYDVVIKLKARVESGLVNKRFETEYEGIWG